MAYRFVPSVTTMVLTLAILASAASARASEVNPALLDSWERAWDYTADQTSRRFLAQVNKQFLLTLERGERDEVRDKLRRIIASGISWDLLGDGLVESMVAACGNELLEDIAPYVGLNQFGDADREAVEDYTTCYNTAMRETMEAIPVAIAGKFEEIDTLLRRHGIDPDAEPPANALPPGLRNTWSVEWDQRMAPIVDDFVERYEEPLFQAFAPSEAEEALAEIRGTIESTLAWDAVSALVVDEIENHCGRPLLEAVEPYLTSGVSLADADQRLATEYEDCYRKAMRVAPMLALQELVNSSKAEAVLSKYNDTLSSYQRISPNISTVKVEQRYGALFDEIAALHDIRSGKQRDAAVQDLKNRLQSDPAIIHVSLQDPGHPHTVYGELFHFYQDGERATGKSCHGSSPPEQERLSRCSWNSGKYSKDNVISYSRSFVHRNEELGMAVEFDYDALLREFSD